MVAIFVIGYGLLAVFFSVVAIAAKRVVSP